MVTRFLSGHKPQYKPINYDHVAAYSKIRNSSAQRSLQKISKLQEINKNTKKLQLLQQHRRIWESEMRRLKSAEDKIENEILALQPTTQNFELPTTPIEELYEDIFDLKDSLKLQMTSFVKNTVNPIHELRDDLQEWIQQNKSKLALGFHDSDNEKAISKTVSSVKKQQAMIFAKLEQEQKTLENALQGLLELHQESCTGNVTHRSDSTNNSTYMAMTKLPNIVVGVPQKVLQLECPDEGLKESSFEEFESLDEKYVNAIECLEEKYKDVIER